MADIAECLMLIEEESIESNHIPDHARVRLLEIIDQESNGRKQVVVKYVQNLGPNSVTRTKVVYDWKLGDKKERLFHNDTYEARPSVTGQLNKAKGLPGRPSEVELVMRG